MNSTIRKNTGRTRTFKRGLATAATLSLLAAPVAACSSETENDAPTDEELSEVLPPEPAAEIVALQGEQTEIILDEGFVTALGDLGLTPGTTGDGTLTDGTLGFPITGGNVTLFEPGEVSPYVIGQLQHVGSGLALQAGDTTVALTDFNVDPGVSRVYGDVTVNGETVVDSAYLFKLNGSTLKPVEMDGDNAILEGTEVYISPVAAGLLNETFGTDAVTEDLLVGIARLTVNTTPADEG